MLLVHHDQVSEVGFQSNKPKPTRKEWNNFQIKTSAAEKSMSKQ